MPPELEATPPPVEPKRSAPVTPWTPRDKTEAADPPHRPAPVPTAPPIEPPAQLEVPSRFVVPRSNRTNDERPRNDAPVEAPRVSANEGPPIRRFDQVKIFRTQSAAPVQGTPSGSERFQPPAPLAPTAEVGSEQTVTPQLRIEKRGPYYQKAGATLAYQIVLKNIGLTTATQIRVEDEIPGHDAKRSIQPTPVYAPGGPNLAWVVPILRPGEERMFVLELVPNRPGDLVSTTSVVITQSTSFRASQEDDGLGNIPDAAADRSRHADSGNCPHCR